jgi:beta-lactamase regulating signal transducer with metallopeptidase domain
MNALPILVVLAQWTVLFALGWIAHWLLRERHSRWRLILWRGILCTGLLVPVTQFVPVHVFQIPVYKTSAALLEISRPFPVTAVDNSIQKDKPITQAPTKSTEANTPAKNPTPVLHQSVSRPVPWLYVLPTIWGLVAVFAGFRLVRLQLQLNRLRRRSFPAGAKLCARASDVQRRLGIKRKIDIRVSDFIASSFACGLLKPAILLSHRLALELPSDEISALLAHEIAHFRRHDLFWCVGWRWMQAVFWFHPLVWKIPAVHNLACEQESDRMASEQIDNRANYSQLLARLALKVLALPAVETQLVLNGTSQIARRIDHLKREKKGNWNWRYSAAGFGLVGLLFIIATGCQISKGSPVEASAPKNTKFEKVLVVVQDPDGKPIEGATISPTGFRVKGIHGADAYNWKMNDSGPPEKATTDKDGKAWVKYPVMGIPDEKELSGALIFGVSCPGFASTFIQTYYLDGQEKPIQLSRAAHLEVSAYFGAVHQPVADLIPIIVPDDSHTNNNGVLVFDQLPPGRHLIQLMGRLPSGDIIYSDATDFMAEVGKPCSLSLEMKPGIRLEGRIDDQVARPVKNGRVMISVRASQYYPVSDVVEDFYAPDDKYGGYTARVFWHSYRPINEDGTFVFESVPPGEADVAVLGDGFMSKTIGQLYNRVNGIVTTKGLVTVIPQAFPLSAPLTKIEVKTEPAATLVFTATTKSGKPIEGVWAGMYPSAFRMWGPLGWKKESSEEPYRQVPNLPDLDFSGKTDENGKLILQNVPPEERGLEVSDSKYQVPIQQPHGWRDRYIRTTFSPGETNQLTLVMEPKGTDYLGTAR